MNWYLYALCEPATGALIARALDVSVEWLVTGEEPKSVARGA